MKLSEIYKEVCLPLEAFTKHHCVIAGGAVRDRFWGRKPRDYDVFVLEGKLGPPMHNLTVKLARNLISALCLKDARFTDYNPGSASKYPTGSAPACSFRYCGWLVQVIVEPVKTVPDLLEKFDWNICQYAYDAGTVTKPENIAKFGAHLKAFKQSKYKYVPGAGPIYYGPPTGTLVLNRKAVEGSPVLALRRGLLFSERYNVHVNPDDIKWLAGLCGGATVKDGLPLQYLTASAIYEQMKKTSMSLMAEMELMAMKAKKLQMLEKMEDSYLMGHKHESATITVTDDGHTVSFTPMGNSGYLVGTGVAGGAPDVAG